MKKRISQSIVYCVVLLVVLSAVVYADSYDSNGGWGTTTSTGYTQGDDGSDYYTIVALEFPLKTNAASFATSACNDAEANGSFEKSKSKI